MADMKKPETAKGERKKITTKNKPGGPKTPGALENSQRARTEHELGTDRSR